MRAHIIAGSSEEGDLLLYCVCVLESEGVGTETPRADFDASTDSGLPRGSLAFPTLFSRREMRGVEKPFSSLLE